MKLKSKNLVILVHGFGDTSAKMRHIEKYLIEFGWRVYSVTLSPSTGKIGIDELAKQLEWFIRDNVPLNEKIDLIGFSMGGLVCRYYIQRLGGNKNVERLITISTPHKGTFMAYLLNNVGSRQMRYQSDFIKKLNDNVSILNLSNTTSIYTPFDLMILPATSSYIQGGRNIKIWNPLHPLMVKDRRCKEAIVSALIR